MCDETKKTFKVDYNIEKWGNLLTKQQRISNVSITNMDEVFIDNINKCVKENDVLFHLGDFVYGVNKSNYRKICIEFRNKIKCKNVHLIAGNHDGRNYGEDLSEIEDLFSSVSLRKTIRINGQGIVMGHYPIAVWNKVRHKFWNLYGHSHSTAEDFLDKCFDGRLSVDVGMDNSRLILGEYRPFSFTELDNFFFGRQGHIVDHHA